MEIKKRFLACIWGLNRWMFPNTFVLFIYYFLAIHYIFYQIAFNTDCNVNSFSQLRYSIWYTEDSPAVEAGKRCSKHCESTMVLSSVTITVHAQPRIILRSFCGVWMRLDVFSPIFTCCKLVYNFHPFPSKVLFSLPSALWCDLWGLNWIRHCFCNRVML